MMNLLCLSFECRNKAEKKLSNVLTRDPSTLNTRSSMMKKLFQFPQEKFACLEKFNEIRKADSLHQQVSADMYIRMGF